MNKGKVFVVQECFKKDEKGFPRPLFNLNPARQFGQITMMLPSGSVMLHPIPMIKELKQKLKNFCDDDCILPIGDPVAIAVAATIAANNNRGRFKMLKWDRRERVYDIIEIIL